MNYHLRSFRTKSYWLYALCSVDSLKTFIAVVGGTWTIVDISDSFHLLDKTDLPAFWIYVLMVIGIITVIITRRPVKKISYKYPGEDLSIEVRIDDIFNISGQKVISTNTTFDTDIANGIISPNSLQGQFTNKFYSERVNELNEKIDIGLNDTEFTVIEKEAGKNHRYDFGTTVKFREGDQFFYWFAMSDLNYNNNARTTLNNVQKSLDGLWDFIANKGEKIDIVIPAIGSGLGRLKTSRKKLIAIIAQSFINASEESIFSNKLIIVVHPSDISKSSLNLFEVKDLLRHYLP
ncbi:macro domain-containing protein [Pedobacter zeae]|uniref:Thoeris protein ThsA Macro domain-containing protein n=1 Tax=Pedobacter zeae TaxID=1737356 RepID=A0A7W6P5W6_9SPHI|nr:macro domain-containing protein [Pedobacter zeae]MBB4108472.1 hypothetical protein [Pedobacter zeae]GGG92575.1 hypothetical protein GCM10007422_02070 [Pedobacter zeae]